MDIVKIVISIWQALPDDVRQEIIGNIEENIGKLWAEIFRGKSRLPEPMIDEKPDPARITTMGPKYDPVLAKLAVDWALSIGDEEELITEKYATLLRIFGRIPEAKAKVITETIYKNFTFLNPKSQEYTRKLSKYVEEKWRSFNIPEHFSGILSNAAEIGYLKRDIPNVGTEAEYRQLKHEIEFAFGRLIVALDKEEK